MIDLSVVIVSHNVCDLLCTCLRSLQRAKQNLALELFVVDNASEDDTLEVVARDFPEVHLIDSGANLGFARANNLALKRAGGRHLMILNPDTVVGERSLVHLVEYLDSHPEVGAVGPKVLDPDGSFQTTSKRGLPTPWASFCKLSGLSAIFPRSAVFNRYEMGHLDPNQSHEVEVLYGAAMMVRHEAYKQVGGLDESYFMFGEDVAWSDAIRKAGWRLVYLPGEPILHVKGESTRRSTTDRDRHFHGAMRIFARRHFRLNFFSRLMIDSGIVLALLISKIRRNRSRWAPVLLDLALVYFAFWTVFPLSQTQPPLPNSLAALLFALIAAVIFVQGGLYRQRPRPFLGFLLLTPITFALFTAAAYFFRSRLIQGEVMALAGGFALVYLLIARVVRELMRHRAGLPKALVLGTDSNAREWVERAKSGESGRMMLIGFTCWQASEVGEVVDDLPVLGPAEETAAYLRRWRVRILVVSLLDGPTHRVIQLLESKPMPSARVILLG